MFFERLLVPQSDIMWLLSFQRDLLLHKLVSSMQKHQIFSINRRVFVVLSFFGGRKWQKFGEFSFFFCPRRRFHFTKFWIIPVSSGFCPLLYHFFFFSEKNYFRLLGKKFFPKRRKFLRPFFLEKFFFGLSKATPKFGSARGPLWRPNLLGTNISWMIFMLNSVNNVS